ncbi:hypothetical protein [Microbacterium sp.]|uniref:hypothetical protein n=1 Tax=Microbacterium sp. TaxID=51671 RepID=UPI0025E8DEF2|nr:hypothetical protein [Microbacterium sp.]
MLVNRLRTRAHTARTRAHDRHTARTAHTTRTARADDQGSALVSVVVIMLVLSLVAMTAAAVVTGTASSIVQTRGGVQAKAAADAGISAALAQARRTSDFCALSLTASTPSYSVTSTCTTDRVTFTSTGRGTDGGTTVTRAVYAYETAPSFGGAAELVFFNPAGESVYFTNHVMPKSTGLTAVEFPAGGGFECKTVIPGDVRIKGSFQGQSGCTITGSLHAGGSNPFGAWSVYLNNSDVVQGSVTSGGSTAIGGSISKVGGTLTLPQSAKLQIQWADVTAAKPTSHAKVANGAANGIRWQPSVTAPTFDPWFDYAYKAADWPGFDIVTITPMSAPYSCSTINGKTTTFWNTFVTGLAKNTVVDTTACTNGIDTAFGADAKAQLGVNLVLVANSFSFGKFTLTPKSGTDPQAWFVVPDAVADKQPTCVPGRTIETDAYIDIRVKAMAYTPCTLRVGNGGTWTGSMYAGTLDDGGSINIYAHSMALPGQWGAGPGGSGATGGGTTTLGALLSQRDIS